jgi:hypothetical protein
VTVAARLRPLLVVLPAFALAGCYSPDRDALDREAHRLIAAGARLDAAMTRLGQNNFTCLATATASAASATCTRSREYDVIATCVERIELTATPRGLDITVPDIACTGL